MAGILDLFKAVVPDVSRNNRFLVWVPGMPADLVVYCINVNMPGESYATNLTYDPQPGKNMIPWELPYDIVQPECSMTFMLDPFYRNRSFFDNWRKEIWDPKLGFGYMDDYAKDVRIWQLSRQFIPTYTMTLTSAYPKFISDTNFDASSQNTFAQFTVSFIYGGAEVVDSLGFVLSKIGVSRPSFV